jgi:toxin ParE1/3/4
MTEARYDILITAEALADIQAIQDYLRSAGADAVARDFLDRIVARVAPLETFPFRGSVPKEFADLGVMDFRQIVMPPYRIIYEVIGARVEIMLVTDGRRDMHSLIRDFLLKHPPGSQ